MRYLNLGIVAEGNSDHVFLPTILHRAMTEMCMESAAEMVELSSVRPMAIAGGAGQARRIADAATAMSGSSILFYHYDGTANPERERGKKWDPIQRYWNGAPHRKLISVVPIKELEAWALADRAALRRVARGDWTGGVYQAHLLDTVERLDDPKRTLNEIVEGARSRGRRRFRARDYLTELAERLEISHLHKVPSFTSWWADTLRALRELEIIDD